MSPALMSSPKSAFPEPRSPLLSFVAQLLSIINRCQDPWRGYDVTLLASWQAKLGYHILKNAGRRQGLLDKRQKTLLLLGERQRTALPNIAITALVVIRVCAFALVLWVSIPAGQQQRRSRLGNLGLLGFFVLFFYFFFFQFRTKRFLFCVLGKLSNWHSEANDWFIYQFIHCFWALLVRSNVRRTVGGVDAGGENASRSTPG